MGGKESAVLIVAEPGEFRESVRALLVSILPDILILDAADPTTAEALVRLHRPGLVVIDGGLHTGRPVRLVETVRKTLERVRCCLLADTVRQQAAALAAGADDALIKGEPAVRLLAQFEHLLPPA